MTHKIAPNKTPAYLYLAVLMMLMVLINACTTKLPNSAKTSSTPSLNSPGNTANFPKNTIKPADTLTPTSLSVAETNAVATRWAGFDQQATARVAATATRQSTIRTPQPKRNVTPSPVMSATATSVGEKLMTKGWYRGSSKDGKWLWEADDQTRTTHFVRADGKVEWYVELPDEALGEWRNAKGFYWPVFMMPDQSYYYMVGYVCCWDSPMEFLVNPGIGLVRLDLRTGQVSTQIPDKTINDFIFSPKGKYLLYVPAVDNPKPRNILHFVRLMDWKQIDIDVPGGKDGAVAWSADNNQAIVESCHYNPPDFAYCVGFQLTLIDVKNARYRVIVPDLEKKLNLGAISPPSIDWFLTDQIKISTIQIEENLEQEWLMDINTGETQEVTQ